MPSALQRFFDGDVWHSFRTSPVAMAAAAVALLCVFCAVFAHWVAPHNPFDLASLELGDARLPPAWEAEGKPKYLLGTDDQGRDVLSALMYGARISLLVGLASVAVSVVVGVGLGLLSGFVVGRVDAGGGGEAQWQTGRQRVSAQDALREGVDGADGGGVEIAQGRGQQLLVD